MLPEEAATLLLFQSNFSSKDPFSVMSVSWFSPKPLQDVETQTSVAQSPGSERALVNPNPDRLCAPPISPPELSSAGQGFYTSPPPPVTSN